MELKVLLNRKFTRHHLPEYGSPNLDADPMLQALVSDAVDNGASAKGVDVTSKLKAVCYEGIGQYEIDESLAHYIAAKGEGCDVIAADCCRCFVKIPDANMDDLVPASYPIADTWGGEDWTWNMFKAGLTVFSLSHDGFTYFQGAAFRKGGTYVKATEHLALQADLETVHVSELPEVGVDS